MNREEVLAAFDREMRREAVADDPGAVVERDGDVVRQVGPEDGWNGVLWSGLRSGEDADAAIAAQVKHFGALGRPFEWKVYGHDRPADLAGRLLAAGFIPEPVESLMVARADGIPGAPVPDGIRLVPVTGQDGVELVADVHEAAFGAGRVHIRERLHAQLAAGTVVAVVAMAGDVPVSAARMDLHPGTRFASLWGGGTVPEWRRRGVYRALVAYRAREAVARGYDFLQVDATDQSHPILLRLGFAELTTTTPYVHP
ncbi:GNAT family N-acetyltransferase [Nonomuraea monospora]|uniref:GNAT family N-acetyltransferase n=1 Tax=Nonomuraea monospora TaxID=568818 RepID=A0ABP5PL39_9ACTN